MGNMSIIAALVIILVLAVFYVCKAKKSGKKCIGCPDSCNCGAEHKNSCSCGCEEHK